MAQDTVKPARSGRRRRGRQAGFTLVEVMVSILLAAVATSGVIGLYTTVSRSGSYSRHATEATVLAQDQLEKLRTKPSLASCADPCTENVLIDERGKPGGLFNRSWSVTPINNYFDLVVTVAWSEDGVARQVVVRSKRYKQP